MEAYVRILTSQFKKSSILNFSLITKDSSVSNSQSLALERLLFLLRFIWPTIHQNYVWFQYFDTVPNSLTRPGSPEDRHNFATWRRTAKQQKRTLNENTERHIESWPSIACGPARGGTAIGCRGAGRRAECVNAVPLRGCHRDAQLDARWPPPRAQPLGLWRAPLLSHHQLWCTTLSYIRLVFSRNLCTCINHSLFSGWIRSLGNVKNLTTIVEKWEQPAALLTERTLQETENPLGEISKLEN